MKAKPLVCAALLVLLTMSGPIPAYTSGQAEDAFFWHYWNKVFVEPDPTPPSDTLPEELPDFGLFFVNTSRFESFWAVAGISHVVWGADWFRDKTKDDFTPFSDENSIMSARMVLAGVWKNAFRLPLNFQVGGYVKWVNGHTFTGKQLQEEPRLVDYTYEPATRIVLGGFYQTSFDSKRFVGDLQWVPGVGDFLQPANGAINLGVRALGMLAGPTTLWRTTDSSSAFQIGLNAKRRDLGFIYSVRLQNSYRQTSHDLDYGEWSSSLGDSKLWSVVLEGQTPGLKVGFGTMHLLFGFWNSAQDKMGWRLGLANYFSKTLHMDLSLSYNEWIQDPVVGRTDSYKLVLSYFN